jgi:pimeloyl-ACP methyl ester carboxylesterase
LGNITGFFLVSVFRPETGAACFSRCMGLLLLLVGNSLDFTRFLQGESMRIFLHGLESSSRGAKASFLRDVYPDIVVPDFQGSLAARMASLQDILAGQRSVALIGSSFGGLMATIYAMANPDNVERMVLLAPALNFPEFSRYSRRRLVIPVWMIIGRDDSVTPAGIVLPLAEKIFADLRYTEAADDHMLAKSFRQLDWQAMLGAPW